MADTEIKAGDTVMLKSGDPMMTVRWVGDDYGVASVNCDWFDSNKPSAKPGNATYPITSVMKA